jgi:hypothetical protein
VSCCETCPLFSAFAVEPGWMCLNNLINEIEMKCENRLYIDRKAAMMNTTLEKMLEMNE